MLDRTDPEGAIAEAAAAYSNWGRWGEDDVLGTVNFIDAAKRREAAALIRRGVSFSLAQRFDMDGPQRGWRRRTNPVHTMLDTGADAALGGQGFPHGFGGADDVIAMPLQCSTQWDGLGHIFDHAKAWNGRPAEKVVTSEGDLVTGIEHLAPHVAGRGVLLDVGRVIGDGGELPDGFAITEEHLQAAIDAHGVAVERTDLVYGGPCFIAGYCPTGPSTMYAYLVERARPRESVADADKPSRMRAIAEGYGGAWEEIRADITDPDRINYTWFESLLVERPWNRGRVVLVGDAAHACPPTLAQRAAQCLEDASVLAELLLAAGTVDQALFDAFMDRRFARAKAVVEASVQLGEWQLNPSPGVDVPGLIGRIAAMVTQRP